MIIQPQLLRQYQAIPLMAALVHISRHVYGSTVEQTAKALNISVDSVRVQEMKAKRLLNELAQRSR